MAYLTSPGGLKYVEQAEGTPLCLTEFVTDLKVGLLVLDDLGGSLQT